MDIFWKLGMITGLIAITDGLQEHFVIYRTANEFGDKFDIPSKTCGMLNATCSQYGGTTRGKERCHCKCPSTKATFASNGTSWSCVDDKATQLSEGCGVATSLVNQGLQFSTHDSKEKSVILLNGLTLTQGCKIDTEETQYQSCNGTWKLAGNRTSPTFGLRNLGNSFLLIPQGSTSSYLAGKLVKLKFTAECQSQGKLCLLFKTEGNISCASSLVKERGPTSTNFTTRSASTVPTSLPSTKATSTPNERTAEVLSTSDQSTPLPNGTPKPQSGDEQQNKLKIIIGVTTAAAILVIIFAVIIVANCRKRNYSVKRGARPETGGHAWNPAYGVNPRLENEALGYDEARERDSMPSTLKVISPIDVPYARPIDENNVIVIESVSKI